MLNRESLTRAALNASQAVTCLIELGASEKANKARIRKMANDCDQQLIRATHELRAFRLGLERKQS